jgi:hypothetical protein
MSLWPISVVIASVWMATSSQQLPGNFIGCAPSCRRLGRLAGGRIHRLLPE